MHWVYISPHFDDAALSCGGLVWEQASAGDTVSIWTICAADVPPGDLSPFAQSLHERWNTGREAASQRKMEDLRSCQLLGADARHFNIPDCIYRRHPGTGEFLYTSSDDLNGPLHPGEAPLAASLSQELRRHLQDGMVVVSPLALGDHVDHQLTRQVLDDLGCASWYYQDFPYVVFSAGQLEALQASGWVSRIFPISSRALAAWQDSIAAHASQISTFWSNEDGMRQSIAQYLEQHGGIRLWAKPGA